MLQYRAMTYAVVESGQKQYIVEEGAVIDVELLAEEENAKVKFDKVLLVVDGGEPAVGKPYTDTVVEGKVLGTKKMNKKQGIKYEPGGYRKKFGHSQKMTQVEITKIGSSTKKSSK